MTGHIAPGGIAPVVPVLSMFDPVHVGGDEFGASVHMKVIYKNLLAAGEPGGGKSGLMNACSPRTRPCQPAPAWCCSTASGSSSASRMRSLMSSSAPTWTTPSSRLRRLQAS